MTLKDKTHVVVVLAIQLTNEKTRTAKTNHSFEYLTHYCEVWIYEDVVQALQIIEM